MNELRITQDYAVCSPKQQIIYPIGESDWERLKRMIKAIIPQRRIFQILSSISFGVFASSIFALIGLNTADKLASWVLPTTWILFWCSLVIGIGLLILDNKQKDMIAQSTESVLEEMQHIEQHFDKPAQK